MNRCRLVPIIVFPLLILIGLIVFGRIESNPKSDLVVEFAGWTNLSRSDFIAKTARIRNLFMPNAQGFTPVAYGPCVLLAITNINSKKQIDFTAEAIETFSNGEWIVVARATKDPWMMGGTEWAPGIGSHIPLRIVEELPQDSPWRVRVNYSLNSSKANKFVKRWVDKLTPLEYSRFDTKDQVVVSSDLPPPNLRNGSETLPTSTIEKVDEKEETE